MNEEALYSGYHYLLNETKKSSIDLDKRSSSVKYQYRVFNKFKSLRFLLYVLRTCSGIFIGRKARTFNGCVVADHASSVIESSLKRSGYVYNPEFKVVSRRWYIRIFARDFICIVRLYKEQHRISDFDYYRTVEFFCSYTFWRAFLLSNSVRSVCLARTNNPHRLALGLAANALKIPCYTWSVEKLHVRDITPFKADISFCWSDAQVNNIKELGGVAVLMGFDVAPIRRFDIDSISVYGLGLLLNAKVNLGSLLKYIDELNKIFGYKRIGVRPHPGSQLKQSDFPDYVVFHSWDRPLTEFLGQYHFMISMVSNAAVDALARGVAVVYAPQGLDEIDYSKSQYLINEFIPVLPKSENPVKFAYGYYLNKFDKYSEVSRTFNNDFSFEALNVKKIFG